jgi:hypothetical protein
MIRTLFASVMFMALTSCATMSAPNPVFVNKIDSYFNKTRSATYEASGKFKRPIAYEVGQYVVTGMTHKSERSVGKMAIVGKERDGWIIEMYSLSPNSESTTQMLVKGMEAAQETGSIDGLDFDWVKIKDTDEPAQRIDGPVLAMTKGFFKKALSALEGYAGMMHDGGNMRVSAGNFNGSTKTSSEVSFMGRKYMSDIWLHPSVPINGMLKSVNKNEDIQIELLDFGLSGAKRSF